MFFLALVSRYLSSSYTFTIEQNNSDGRSVLMMMRIPGMDYYTDDRVVGGLNIIYVAVITGISRKICGLFPVY